MTLRATSRARLEVEGLVDVGEAAGAELADDLVALAPVGAERCAVVRLCGHGQAASGYRRLSGVCGALPLFAMV